jgi:hypothetical protein
VTRSALSSWALPWLLAVLCSAGPLRAAEEAEFGAAIDREEIALDETVRLDLTATTGSRGERVDLQLPDFADFDVVGRGSSDQSSFIFSGGAPSIRRTTVTTLQLSPHRAGTLTIEPARLLVGGRTYRTQPLTVRVLAAGQQATRHGRGGAPPDRAPGPPPHGQDPFEGGRPGKGDFTLKASIDVEQPYVGQQVTWSLWLLARVPVSGIDKLQLPKLDSFWTEEIDAPQQLTGEARVVEGVPVHAFLLRRRALFPLKAGKVSIDPASVEVVSGMGMLFQRSSVKRETPAIPLEVQPLPQNRPPGFDPGNVGQWSLSATAEPLTVAVGQPVTVRIVASGRGNLRDLALPRLPVVPGLRAYEAMSSDKVGIEQGRAGGSRTVEQLVVPERTGEVEIPPLSMAIFDPLAREYRTLTTKPLRIAVVSGAGEGAGSAAGTAQNLLSAGGIRPIRLRLRRVFAGAPPWDAAWFWAALAAPPALLCGSLGLRALSRVRLRDPEEQRTRAAARTARRRLQAALQGASDEEQGRLSTEVAQAVAGYLEERHALRVAGLTREALSLALAERHRTASERESLGALLDACDEARFSPLGATAGERTALVERALALIESLERPAGGAA